LSVVCNDPLNPANVATSATQTVFVLSAGSSSPSGNCAGQTAPPSSTVGTPIANAGSAYTGTATDPVQFSGTGSLPSGGAVLTTCVWTFGDGDRATTLNPVHSYGAPGTYAVTLTVSDSAGLSATATTTATIAPAPLL
jgi:PKD repeat protein